MPFTTDVTISTAKPVDTLCAQGFVATLKDSYGFIESEEHDCELFFPFR